MEILGTAAGSEEQIKNLDLSFLAKKKSIANLRVMEFIKDSKGNFSGARLFGLILVITTIADWMYAVFTKGAWKPNWEQIGMVLGILGFKYAQKTNE